MLFKHTEKTSLNIEVSNKEKDVFQFIKRYIAHCGYGPTDKEIAFEFEFSEPRASNIIRNLQFKKKIVVGNVRRTLTVL